MPNSVSSIPEIMGIMNVTPDSFYVGSRIDPNQSINYTRYQYADIVDIGFESSRPGANPVSEEDELNKLFDFLDNVAHFEQTLSIDTYKPHVAKIALENGFNMINDIMGGGKNGEMLEIASLFECPIVLMHMKGKPAIMQNRPFYDDVMDELLLFFENKLELARNIGVNDNQIILDPGIGFGKNLKHNLTLISKISLFHSLGFPILVGTSRKRFISQISGKHDSKDRIGGTLASVLFLLSQGVQIFRVHDVNEVKQGILVFKKILLN